jgi:hypothetical protein
MTCHTEQTRNHSPKASQPRIALTLTITNPPTDTSRCTPTQPHPFPYPDASTCIHSHKHAHKYNPTSFSLLTTDAQRRPEIARAAASADAVDLMLSL